MSFKDIPPLTLAAIMGIARAAGLQEYHITPTIVCDCCQDENREAFPYYVKDENGREWAHLCNLCFDLLGCEINLDALGYEFGVDVSGDSLLDTSGELC